MAQIADRLQETSLRERAAAELAAIEARVAADEADAKLSRRQERAAELVRLLKERLQVEVTAEDVAFHDETPVATVEGLEFTGAPRRYSMNYGSTPALLQMVRHCDACGDLLFSTNINVPSD